MAGRRQVLEVRYECAGSCRPSGSPASKCSHPRQVQFAGVGHGLAHPGMRQFSTNCASSFPLPAPLVLPPLLLRLLPLAVFSSGG